MPIFKQKLFSLENQDPRKFSKMNIFCRYDLINEGKWYIYYYQHWVPPKCVISLLNAGYDTIIEIIYWSLKSQYTHPLFTNPRVGWWVIVHILTSPEWGLDLSVIRQPRNRLVCASLERRWSEIFNKSVSCVGKKYHISPRPQIEFIAYVHAAWISLWYALYWMKNCRFYFKKLPLSLGVGYTGV